MSYRVVRKKENYSEYFEEKLKPIFEAGDIEKCLPRFMATMSEIYKPQGGLIAQLCQRALMGGVFIYPYENTETFPLLSELEDDEIEEFVEVPWDYVEKIAKDESLPEKVRLVMEDIFN